jgi:LmbE family N-acetylglucosaminyl deacetylase
MLELKLGEAGKRRLKILCIGAHCDDIEIGCGGSVLELLGKHRGTEVHWIVCSSGETRKAEAIASANQFLDGAEDSIISIWEFQDGFLPYHGREIKERFESLKESMDPDVIFTHCRADAHQDHRLVNELTWNTFRNHFVLEYEIPKYDGDLGQPNVYVLLDERTWRKKVKLLMEAFPTQNQKPWYSEETFRAILQLRAIECRAPSGYAEAFHFGKMIVG